MPNTYSQVFIQLVFTVRGRENLISPEWETELHKYITTVIQNQDQILIAINGMPDHLHILLGIKPTCRIADLAKYIKQSSGNFIRQNNFSRQSFHWQEGYGVFSYSRWDVEKIKNYIANQKEHHKGISFRDEYQKLLREFDVPFDNAYLFEFYDNQ
jgi:putative transposase